MKSRGVFVKRTLLFVSALSLLLNPSSSFGATFCVSNSTEFQSALTTAASNGEDDTIQIIQGTYNGNFTYASTNARRLVVEGGYNSNCTSQIIDPKNTILDGGDADHVLVLISQDSASFSVEGLTLQNGTAKTATDGGGLYVKSGGYVSGSINLSKSIICDNVANMRGGGAYIDGRGNTLTNNTFTRNSVGNQNGSFGGGAYIIGSSKLINNTFTDNVVSSSVMDASGGGVYILGTNTLNNNIFIKNFAWGGYTDGYGGGVFASSDYLTISNNIFTENSAGGDYGDGWGGGLFINSSNGIVTNNTFTENTAISGIWEGASQGGGIYGVGGTFNGNTFIKNSVSGGSTGTGGGAHLVNAVLTNNILVRNSINSVGTGLGGGLYVDGGTLTNNTLSGNSAMSQGGGIFGYFRDAKQEAQIYNNIIWNNDAPEGSDLYIDNRQNDNPFFSAPVNLFNNDFDQSATGTFIEIPFDIDTSNLANQNPLFSGSDGYHLVSSSPCINVGDNSAPKLPETDKSGVSRILEGTVDIGAYEYTDSPTGPPEAPVLTVTTNGLNVTFAWTPSAYATGYNFFYAPSPYTGPDTISTVDMGAQTTLSANLWKGATYFVAIQAYNEYGGSGYSNVELFKIGENSDAPPRPTGLCICETGSKTAFNGKDASLCWSPTTQAGVKDYLIEVRNTSSDTRRRMSQLIRGYKWTYAHSENMADGGGTPENSLTFRLWSVDDYGIISLEYDEISVTNPALSSVGKFVR